LRMMYEVLLEMYTMILQRIPKTEVTVAAAVKMRMMEYVQSCNATLVA